MAPNYSFAIHKQEEIEMFWIAAIRFLIYYCPWKVNEYLYPFSYLLVTSFHCSVPQKVGDLEANSSGSTKSLVVSWSPPAGDWEQYHILLWNDSSVLLNTTVGKEETHYVIDDVGLIPGRQYEIEVAVESGNLKSSVRCQGRTGKQIIWC